LVDEILGVCQNHLQQTMTVLARREMFQQSKLCRRFKQTVISERKETYPLGRTIHGLWLVYL
jgi:hypothetical protein